MFSARPRYGSIVEPNNKAAEFFGSNHFTNQTDEYRGYHQDPEAQPKSRKRKSNKGNAPPAPPAPPKPPGQLTNNLPVNALSQRLTKLEQTLEQDRCEVVFCLGLVNERITLVLQQTISFRSEVDEYADAVDSHLVHK